MCLSIDTTPLDLSVGEAPVCLVPKFSTGTNLYQFLVFYGFWAGAEIAKIEFLPNNS